MQENIKQGCIVDTAGWHIDARENQTRLSSRYSRLAQPVLLWQTCTLRSLVKTHAQIGRTACLIPWGLLGCDEITRPCSTVLSLILTSLVISSAKHVTRNVPTFTWLDFAQASNSSDVV
jgi:hypothetical protein